MRNLMKGIDVLVGDCRETLKSLPDPFGGSGTTGAVAKLHNRNAILCELNDEYVDLMGDRVDNVYKTMTGKEYIPDEENLFGF